MAQTASKTIDGATTSLADRAAAPRSIRLEEAVGQAVPLIVTVLFAAIFLLPLYWMVVTSLKALNEVFADPLVWWPARLVWENYPQALAQFPFVRYFANTATIAIPVAIGTTISSALVAYAFS